LSFSPLTAGSVGVYKGVVFDGDGKKKDRWRNSKGQPLRTNARSTGGTDKIRSRRESGRAG